MRLSRYCLRTRSRITSYNVCYTKLLRGGRPVEVSPQRESLEEVFLRTAGMQSEISRIMSPLQVGFYTHRVAERLDLRGAEAQIA